MKAKGRVSGSDGRTFQVERKAHERAQRQEVYHVLETEKFLCGQSVASGVRGCRSQPGFRVGLKAR